MDTWIGDTDLERSGLEAAQGLRKRMYSAHPPPSCADRISCAELDENCPVIVFNV